MRRYQTDNCSGYDIHEIMPAANNGDKCHPPIQHHHRPSQKAKRPRRPYVKYCRASVIAWEGNQSRYHSCIDELPSRSQRMNNVRLAP